MTIFYFDSILTALFFCSSAVLWKFACHFLCGTGLWCLDIRAGNYGKFKVGYSHVLEQYSVQPFESYTLELFRHMIVILNVFLFIC